MKIDLTLVSDLEFEDVHYEDSPDFCDAYISSALYTENGKTRNLTEEELEWIIDEHSDWFYDRLMDYLY